MALALRILAAVALALALALPGVSDEGGENTGGSGVWVLPRAVCAPIAMGPVRDERRVPINVDCVMRVSADCGPVGGTFVDDMTCVPIALHVTGSQVRIPAAMLQALVATARPTAMVLISDAQQLGYALHLTVNADGTATIRVY